MPPLLRLSARQTLVIGFVCVFIAFITPWLMLLRVLPNSLLLGFITYGLSVVGLALGIIGASRLGLERRTKKDLEESGMEELHK